MARDFSAAQGPRRGHVAVGGGRWAGIALCAVHRVGAMPRTKTTKRTKTTREMAEWGLWPVIFQQHRAPGGAMGGGRWAAWYSHILCHVLCVLYVLIRPFPGSQYRLCTLCIANQPYLFSERIRYIFSRKPPFFKKFSSSA